MIKIFLSSDNQFYYTVIAKNGKVLTTSEMYKRKANCFQGIDALCKLFGSELTIVDMTL